MLRVVVRGGEGKVLEFSLKIAGGLFDCVPRKRDLVVGSKLELEKLFALGTNSAVFLQKPNEVAQVPEVEISMHTISAHRETFIAKYVDHN